MPVHLFATAELSSPEPGVYQTPEVPTDLLVKSLVGSWNAALPHADPYEVSARVLVGSSWSPWLPLARRGLDPGPAPSYPKGLRLAADEVISETLPIEAGQLRFKSDPEGAPPRRMALSYWPNFAPIELPNEEVESAVRVERVRQYGLAGGEGHRQCGPCSLTMGLRHFGIECDPLEVAKAVKDPWSGIYGNWSLLAAYASERGLSAWVERGGGPRRLAEHLGRGRLAVVSLKWSDHELPGAAIPSSDGHLVLAVGACREGLIVLDPAFRDETIVTTCYDWQGLLRAWKSGAAIVIGRGP